jgi:serine/threonine protein kinase
MRERLNQELAGRYQVERELGRGGMASVWLAHDLKLHRPVALKVLHPELAGAIGVDRFVREIQLTARLSHPNIVPVLDSGILAGGSIALPWYTMAYIEGESLRARLSRDQVLPVEEAVRLTAQAGAALAAAHRMGVVHRDIKPENLLLSDGHLRVVDFGIAKALTDTGGERLTSTGFAVGTLAYMSPEQSSAEPVDARTDQYSLACVLYEMLAGEPPFTGPSTQAIVARRMSEPARGIRAVRSTVPAPVESAVLRALERVPADRFPDIASFVGALGLATPERIRPKSRRAPYIAAGILLLASIAVAVAALARRPAARGLDPTTNALYRRGLRAYEKRTPEGAAEAIATFQEALARDSGAAPVWVALAKTYARAYERPFTIPAIAHDSLLRLAVRAVDRARAIDSASSEAWVATALVSRSVDPTDLSQPMNAVRRALALDSSNAEAWHYLATVVAESGDLAGGIADWRRAVAAAPSYTQGLAFLSLGHYWARQYDSAAHWADSAIAVDPSYLLGRSTAGYVAVERGDFARARAQLEAAVRLTSDVELVNSLAGLALAEARAGQTREAQATLARAESLSVGYTAISLHTVVYLAQAHVALHQNQRALAWLARFPTPASVHFQLHLRCDPPFDPIADDARFKALLTVPRPAGPGGCGVR